MTIFAEYIQAFYTLSWVEVTWRALVINIGIFIGALLLGEILVRVYRQKSVSEPAPPITWQECALAALTVILNSGVMVVGAIMWRMGLIRVEFDLNPLRVLLDTIVLFLAMDLAMYISHRIAHHPKLYPLLHQTHHQYEHPRPLTLFVLNPMETLGFGALWLVLLLIYPSTWLGILIYLTLNLLFGLVGHLGVEPYPQVWVNLPLLRLISTSTFHAEHHDDRYHNFGFYTLIWDRLFGTLSPDYLADFSRANQTPPKQA